MKPVAAVSKAQSPRAAGTVVVDLKIHLLNGIKEQSSKDGSMSICETERDSPLSVPCEKKTFSFGSLWSKVVKSMKNMVDEIDSHY